MFAGSNPSGYAAVKSRSVRAQPARGASRPREGSQPVAA